MAEVVVASGRSVLRLGVVAAIKIITLVAECAGLQRHLGFWSVGRGRSPNRPGSDVSATRAVEGNRPYPLRKKSPPPAGRCWMGRTVTGSN